VSIVESRDFIGIELNPEYADIQEKRLKKKMSGLGTRQVRIMECE